MRVHSRFISVFALFVVSLSLNLDAEAKPKVAGGIPNFQKIRPDIFRGGRPGKEGILYAKSLGVKTIVNVESNEKEIDEEIRFANSLGIRVLSYPLTGFSHTEEESVNGALEAMADPNLRPLFLHCAHGKDRSGLVSAIFRVEQDGWTPKRAYKEMKDLGFHWFMFSLKKFFKERTGYDE